MRDNGLALPPKGTSREMPEKKPTRTRSEGLTQAQRLLLASFRDWLELKGMSRRTVTDYPVDVAPFLGFVEGEGLENLRAVTRAHLEGYGAFLAAKTHRGKVLSIRTVSGRLGQLKTFFRFLLATGRIYHDPAASLILPKRGDRLPRGVLTIEEVTRLLDAPDLRKPTGIRDRAILELLYSSGLRNTELRNLEVSNLDLESRSLFVLGKGHKEAFVPFGREAQRALEHYLRFARPLLKRGWKRTKPKTRKMLEEEAGKDYLFLTKAGHRLDQAILCHTLWRYARLAGLDHKVSPHNLRHTCATHLLKNGADIRHIQGLLRHKDLSSTQIYTRLHIEDLKAAQLKYHPRERPKVGEDADG